MPSLRLAGDQVSCTRLLDEMLSSAKKYVGQELVR